MKKTYLNPELKLVKIHTTQMIAASPGYSTTITTSETSGNLSREGGDFWDDEE